LKSYILKKTAGNSLSEINQSVRYGGKFVVYPYCVSILALTFRLTSSPHYIKSGEPTSKYRRKYTIYSLLFGWWGIPWGPIYTTDALVFSKKNKGDLDITDEIVNKLNLHYASRNVNEPFETDIIVEYSDGELANVAPKRNHT